MTNSNFAQFVKNLICWVHLKLKNVIENFKVSNSQINLLYVFADEYACRRVEIESQVELKAVARTKLAWANVF